MSFQFFRVLGKGKSLRMDLRIPRICFWIARAAPRIPRISPRAPRLAFSLRERSSWNWGGPQASDICPVARTSVTQKNGFWIICVVVLPECLLESYFLWILADKGLTREARMKGKTSAQNWHLSCLVSLVCTRRGSYSVKGRVSVF